MFVPVEQLVDKNIGQYKLTKLIGMSVLSAVYEARPEQGSPMMLTVFRLPDECVGEPWELFMERFEYEAARLKGLQHPHVVPYYEFGEEFGYPYLITPFSANRTLVDLLKQGVCTPAQMMYLLRQIASGLDYVHSNGIVHGSLKPSNILLRDEPGGQRVLIANVGLTQMLEMRGIGQVSYSHPHLFSVAGTLLTNPAYLAPEVVQGASSDARSDMYALGILIYEMLCGRPPFTGSDPLDVALQHVDQRIPPLQSIKPELPQALDVALRRVLERDPARRIQRGEKLVSFFERTASILQEASKENPAFIAQVASNKTVQGMQAEQQWQGMPGITRNKMPSIAPEFAVNSTGAARRSTNSQFKPSRGAVLPPVMPPASPSRPVPLPAPNTGQMFNAPNAPGMQAGQPYRVQAAPQPSEPLATQISSGQQAVRALEPLARQIAPGMQSSGRMPVSPVAPNGYGVQMQGGQQYGAIQAAPSQMWSENYAGPVNPGNGAVGMGMSAPADMQAGMMYNNDPRYVQQPYMEGYGQGDWSQQDQQPYMGGYGQEDWSQQDQELEPSPDQRRRALVIVGGAAVAAVLSVGGFNLLRMLQSRSDQSAVPTDNNNTETQGSPPAGGQQKSGQATSTAANKTTGTVIANQKNLAINATLDFTNPTDKHPSVLVHLPNGNFVAYNKACTHQGVSVAYDPKTNTLICPLHKSAFDPANNGAVVRGPATVRLPQVPIHVNGDGSITVS